ncbi:hypothetical protein JCM11491_000537 [Sporobolomyces phaffii]
MPIMESLHAPPSLSHLPDELLSRIFGDAYVRTQEEVARWEENPKNTTPLSKRFVRPQLEGLHRCVQLHSIRQLDRFIANVLARPQLGSLVRSIEFTVIERLDSDGEDPGRRRVVSDKQENAIRELFTLLTGLRSIRIPGSGRTELKVRYLFARIPFDRFPIHCTSAAIGIFPSTLQRLSLIPNQLRRLDLAFLPTSFYQRHRATRTFRRLSPLPNLSTLSIAFPQNGLCKAIVARCPNLHSLHVYEVDETASIFALVVGALPSPGLVEVFTVSVSCPRRRGTPDLSLASCVTALTGLKALALRIGESMYSDLLDHGIHASSIEALTLRLPNDLAPLGRLISAPIRNPSLKRITLDRQGSSGCVGLRVTVSRAVDLFKTMPIRTRDEIRRSIKRGETWAPTRTQIESLSLLPGWVRPAALKRSVRDILETIRDTGRANGIRMDGSVFHAMEVFEELEHDIGVYTGTWAAMAQDTERLYGRS